MKYEELIEFIIHKMKPDKSDGVEKNYQPVVIRFLNQTPNGTAEKGEILAELQRENPDIKITSRNLKTVTDTLIGHKIITPKGDSFRLLDFESFSTRYGQKAEITKKCENRIYNKTKDFSNKQIEIFEQLSNDFTKWKDTEQGKKRLEEHKEHLDDLREKLSQENIHNLSEASLIDIYKILWGFPWTNREAGCKMKIIEPNGIKKIKDELNELIYGKDSLVDRYDKCEKNLSGVSQSTITEFLYAAVLYC